MDVKDILRDMGEVVRTMEQGGTAEDKGNEDKKDEDKQDGYKGNSEKAGFNRRGAGKAPLNTAVPLGSKGNPIHPG